MYTIKFVLYQLKRQSSRVWTEIIYIKTLPEIQKVPLTANIQSFG